MNAASHAEDGQENDDRPKKGIALVEACLKPSMMSMDFSQLDDLRMQLELLINPRDIFSTGADLPTPGGDHMFDSVKVVEFQGFDPSTCQVFARNVNIKINIYGLHDAPDVVSNHCLVTQLPNRRHQDLWELADVDYGVRFRLSDWATHFVPNPDHYLILLLGADVGGKLMLAKGLVHKISICHYLKYDSIHLHYHAKIDHPPSLFRLADEAQAAPRSMVIILMHDVGRFIKTREPQDTGEGASFAKTANDYLRAFETLGQLENVRIICTGSSSVPFFYDDKLLSRCATTVILSYPSLHERYIILCCRIQHLVEQEWITLYEGLPGWTQANREFEANEAFEANGEFEATRVTPGAGIVRLAMDLEGAPTRFVDQVIQLALSGRGHVQEGCDIHTALSIAQQYIQQYTQQRNNSWGSTDGP